MIVAELKALARERGWRGYSRMRKAGMIKLITNNQQSWALDIPPRNGTTPSGGAQARPMRPNQAQLVRFRQPTQQEMDIF